MARVYRDAYGRRVGKEKYYQLLARRRRDRARRAVEREMLALFERLAREPRRRPLPRRRVPITGEPGDVLPVGTEFELTATTRGGTPTKR